MAKTILVIGATGRQGGSVAKAVQRLGFTIRAMTRDTAGPRAKALAAKGVEVVPGDLSDRASLDAAARGAYGVFSVQALGKEEARQGIAVAEAAAAAKVEHLIYTSVGGAERKTGIPHFEAKFQIEERIRALGVPHTILRPVFFMDNLGTPRMVRSIFFGMLRAAMGDEKPLQSIAVEDIGEFAALAFANRDQYLGKAIELAGDEMTLPQYRQALAKRTGRPEKSFPFPRFLVPALGHDMSSMIRWFGSHGYAADIPAVRAIYPGTQTFEQWLAKLPELK